MISKTSIEKNLKLINRLYQRSTSILTGEFYSKLAILELCGWIEESMDEIIRNSTRRKIVQITNRNIIEKKSIKNNYSFTYDENFKKMLQQVIGMCGIERIESKFNSSKFIQLCSTLQNLKTYRDTQAHTHIKGITIRLNAPSWSIGQFNNVYEGLKDIESTLKREGF